jgi:hypothetical protein
MVRYGSTELTASRARSFFRHITRNGKRNATDPGLVHPPALQPALETPRSGALAVLAGAVLCLLTV